MSLPVDINEIAEQYVKHAYDSNGMPELMDNTTIRWSQKMTRCAGTAQFNVHKPHVIKLSLPLLARTSREDIVNTIVHEACHIVVYNDYYHKFKAGKFILKPKPHGREWRFAMFKAGEQADRCHSIDRTGLKRSMSTITVYCDCSKYEMAKNTYTRRMKRSGSAGICRKCRTRVRA